MAGDTAQREGAKRRQGAPLWERDLRAGFCRALIFSRASSATSAALPTLVVNDATALSSLSSTEVGRRWGQRRERRSGVKARATQGVRGLWRARTGVCLRSQRCDGAVQPSVRVLREEGGMCRGQHVAGL